MESLQDAEEDRSTSEESESAMDPVEYVVHAAHNDKLTQHDLENASVVVPDVVEESISTLALLDHLSDLIADSWPEPSTTEEIQDLLHVACENLGQTTSTSTTTSLVEPNEQNFDSADDLPPLPDAPPNKIFRCVSVTSGDDNIVSSKGKPLRLHIFHGSGNVEIRQTTSGKTRSDVMALESIYSMWIHRDTLKLVLSCPTTARKLTNGRLAILCMLTMLMTLVHIILTFVRVGGKKLASYQCFQAIDQ